METDEPLEKTKEKEMLKLINDFLEIAGIEKTDVMITGSLALSMQGMLPDGRKIKDIDLVIKGGVAVEDRIKQLNNLFGRNVFWKITETRFEGIHHKPYIFNILGTEFNVWMQDLDVDFDSCLHTDEGYRVATVKHIIDAKKSYGRQKDLTDIMKMAVHLMTAESSITMEYPVNIEDTGY